MITGIHMRVGCSGFYNRGWKGTFYPEGIPTSQWLSFYCEHFNSLEINSTFYKLPTVRVMTNWYKKTPADFMFSVKAPKAITHMKKFNDCKQMIDDFYLASAQGLNEKLGCVLFQLPPGIHYKEEKLQQVISCLDKNFKNVIEFRHASWWNQNVYDELSRHGITFCSINHPTLPATIITNTPTAYIRYHGNPELYKTPYTNEELDKLKQALVKENNIQEAYVYFNNTITAAGAENARTLTKLMQDKNEATY